MIAQLSCRVATRMLERGVISGEDRETYEYGVYVILTSLLHVVSVIFIGAVFHMVLESIAYYACFAVLRKFAGGYHAGSPIRCYILSCIVISAVLLLARYASGFVILPAFLSILLFSGIVIFYFSPIEDDNKPLDESERRNYKKRARIILLVEIMISAALFAAGQAVYALIVSMSFVTIAFMLLAGMIKHHFRALEA